MKQSLNHNGVTTQSDTTAATIAASAAPITQQTRPLTLTTTTTTASATGTLKGLKSPKTPQTSGNHIAATSTPNSATHSTQTHYISPTFQSKTSLGSKLTPKTPPVTPDSPTTYLDDDLDSLFSYGTTTSGRSTMSCEHPYVARFVSSIHLKLKLMIF